MTSSDSPHPPKSRKKKLFSLLQMVASAILLVFILSRVGLDEVFAQLSSVNLWLFGLAALVYLSSVVIRAVRWWVMLRPLGIEAKIPELTRLYLLGFFWDTFLPTGFGGDVVKAIELSRSTGNTAHSVTSVIAERVVGLLGTCLIALVVVLFSIDLVPFWVLIAISGISAGIVIGGWLLRLNLLDWLEERFNFLKPVTQNKTARKFDAALKAFDNKTILLGVLTSLPFTFSLVFVNFLLGTALGMEISIIYYLIFVPVVSVVNLLPLSFNGIGVREWMYQLLFEAAAVGVAAGQPVAMALLFNVLRIGLGVVGGVISFVRGTRGLVAQEQPR